jgi:site-specific recombinase XerD
MAIVKSTALVRQEEQAFALKTAKSPAGAYLTGLGTGSRATAKTALDNLAKLLTGQKGRRWHEVEWHQVDYTHLQALRAKLLDRYEPNTVNLHLSCVRGVLREAWRQGLISAEQFARAQDVKGAKASGRVAGREVRAEELRAIFQGFPRGPIGDRDAALLAILCASGLRRSELCNLLLSDWEPSTGKLTVRKGKGGKFREVFLGEEARSYIERWMVWRGPDAGSLLHPVHPSGAIFRRRMSTATVALLMTRLAQKHGLAKLTPHDLRRTFASMQLDAGTDIATVQALMGHADVNTTARYDRRGDERKRKAAQAIHLPSLAPQAR